MTRTYEVISGDGHVEVSTEAWAKYMPERYRSMLPELVSRESADCWVLGEFEMVNWGNLVCDLPYDEIRPGIWRYRYPDGSPRPGTGTAPQRLHEQDLDGLDAEVLYPPVHGPGFLRQIAGKDVDAYLANVQAYNTWLAEEYCAVAPDRLIGNAFVPETGVDDAIAEMKRCKDLGLRSMCLLMWPNGGPTRVPGSDDERFFAASIDLDMRLSPHSRLGEGRADDPRNEMLKPRGPAAEVSIVQLILSGVLDKYPGLQFYFAETQAGWIPHSMNFLDEFYQRWYTYYDGKLPKLPSEYFRDHVLFSFIDDRLAMPMRRWIGIDNLMWGSDFPHSAGTYPHSRDILDDLFEGVPADERRRVLVENPCRFFGLDPDKELTPTPVLASV
jgi:predicted TIM-barrel fold metal-dependent hydrolase